MLLAIYNLFEGYQEAGESAGFIRVEMELETGRAWLVTGEPCQ